MSVCAKNCFDVILSNIIRCCIVYCIALIKLKTLQLKFWKYCRGHPSVLIAEWSGMEAAGRGEGGEDAEALMQLWCRLKKRNSWAVWLPSLYYCNVCITTTPMLKETSLILRIITKIYDISFSILWQPPSYHIYYLHYDTWTVAFHTVEKSPIGIEYLYNIQLKYFLTIVHIIQIHQ